MAGTVLGATVEPYDRDGRQRAVDAVLHYADGRKAALEVSATGPDGETPIRHYLGQRGHSQTVPGVTGTWIVQLPRTFHPADMRKVGEELRQREERGVRLLSELTATGVDLGGASRPGRARRPHRGRRLASPLRLASDSGPAPSWPGRPRPRTRRLARREEGAVKAEEAGRVRLRGTASLPHSLAGHFQAAGLRHPCFQRAAARNRSPVARRAGPGLAPDGSTSRRGRPGGDAGQGWYRDAPYGAIDVSALR